MGFKFEIGQKVEVIAVFKYASQFNGQAGRVVDRWEVAPLFPGEYPENCYQLKFDDDRRATFCEESLGRYVGW